MVQVFLPSSLEVQLFDKSEAYVQIHPQGLDIKNNLGIKS